MKRKTTPIKVTWKDAPGPPPFDEWARDGVLLSTDRTAKWRTDGAIWETGGRDLGVTALAIDGDRWVRRYAPPPRPSCGGPSLVVVAGTIYDTATGEVVPDRSRALPSPSYGPAVSRRPPPRRSGWGSVKDAETRYRLEWPGGAIEGPTDGHSVWHDGETQADVRSGRAAKALPLPWPAELDAIAGLGDAVEWCPARQVSHDGTTTDYPRAVVLDGVEALLTAEWRLRERSEAAAATMPTKAQQRLARRDVGPYHVAVQQAKWALRSGSVWVELDADPPHCCVSMPPREATSRELLYLPDRSVVVAVGWGARAGLVL